ncbi:MAG: hypothetical protein V3V14_05815, partial [Saprospiraceae bacterium]
MKFNPYTLAGRTVRGYGVELTPGKLRFKFIKGKIEDLRAYRDTLELGTNYVPTYARKMTGVSFGFGSRSTYFDLYGVKSEDTLDSLNGEKILEDYSRKSNTVLGSTFSLKISKNIRLRSNFGASFQTENLDSYGENTIVGSNSLTNNLVEANLSSTFTYAGDVALNYSSKLFSLNTKVKYIQPYFQPLTVAYVNTDIINYTIGGSTSFFKHRLNLMGSVGVQKNNLTGNKLSTSNNLILNLIANFKLSKGLSGTVNYTNFTQDYEARIIQINDLYTYAITSNVKAFSLRYSFGRGDNRYNTTFRIGQNDFVTIDDSEEELGAYDSWNSSINIALNNKEQNFRLSTSLTYRKYDRQSNSTSNYGIRINGNKGFFDDLIKLNVNTGYAFNDLNGYREGRTWRIGIVASYKLNDKSNLSLRLNHISRNSSVRSDFSEYRTGLQYLYSF